MIVTVLESNRAKFSKRLVKFTKIMNKNNLEYNVEFLGSEMVELHFGYTYITTKQDTYEINFKQVKTNVTYLGTISYKKDVSTYFSPNSTNLAQYDLGHVWTCAECGTTRTRNICHVFEEKGTIKTIGSSCALAYFGFDFEKLFNSFANLQENEEVTESVFFNLTRYIETKELIKNLNVSTQGFRLNYNKENTFDDYKEISDTKINDYKWAKIQDAKVTYALTDKEIDTIMIKVAKYWNEQTDNNFSHNVKSALLENNNIASYLEMWAEKLAVVGVCFAMKTIVKETSTKGSFVGVIKEKIELTLTPVKAMFFNSEYGTTVIIKFNDKDGNTIIANTSDTTKFYNSMFNNNELIMNEVTIKGTVKSQEFKYNENQTKLTRCSVA